MIQFSMRNSLNYLYFNYGKFRITNLLKQIVKIQF